MTCTVPLTSTAWISPTRLRLFGLLVALEAIADKVVVCDEDTRFVDAVELEVAVECDEDTRFVNVVELEVAVVVGLADVMVLVIAE